MYYNLIHHYLYIWFMPPPLFITMIFYSIFNLFILACSPDTCVVLLLLYCFQQLVVSLLNLFNSIIAITICHFNWGWPLQDAAPPQSTLVSKLVPFRSLASKIGSPGQFLNIIIFKISLRRASRLAGLCYRPPNPVCG